MVRAVSDNDDVEFALDRFIDVADEVFYEQQHAPEVAERYMRQLLKRYEVLRGVVAKRSLQRFRAVVRERAYFGTDMHFTHDLPS